MHNHRGSLARKCVGFCVNHLSISAKIPYVLHPDHPCSVNTCPVTNVAIRRVDFGKCPRASARSPRRLWGSEDCRPRQSRRSRYTSCTSASRRRPRGLSWPSIQDSRPGAPCFLGSQKLHHARGACTGAFVWVPFAKTPNSLTPGSRGIRRRSCECE